MAIKISVIALMGENEAPKIASINIDGKFSMNELKQKCLIAVAVPMQNADRFDIEVRDENGQSTKKITKTCKIFLKIKQIDFSQFINQNPPDIFGDIFKKTGGNIFGR